MMHIFDDMTPNELVRLKELEQDNARLSAEVERLREALIDIRSFLGTSPYVMASGEVIKVIGRIDEEIEAIGENR